MQSRRITTMTSGVQMATKLRLPCGCWVGKRKGQLMLWLLARQHVWLFDLLHGSGVARNLSVGG